MFVFGNSPHSHHNRTMIDEEEEESRGVLPLAAILMIHDQHVNKASSTLECTDGLTGSRLSYNLFCHGN